MKYAVSDLLDDPKHFRIYRKSEVEAGIVDGVGSRGHCESSHVQQLTGLVGRLHDGTAIDAYGEGQEESSMYRCKE